MPTKEFDAGSHTAYVTTFDDKTFALEGEPDGDAYNATFDNDAVGAIEGAKEDVQFSLRGASLGTFTKTMQWGADTNKILNQVFKDQKAGNFAKRVEIKRINQSENVLVLTCARAVITKIPDLVFGVAAADRPWAFKLEKMEFPETQAPA